MKFLAFSVPKMASVEEDDDHLWSGRNEDELISSIKYLVATIR